MVSRCTNKKQKKRFLSQLKRASIKVPVIYETHTCWAEVGILRPLNGGLVDGCGVYHLGKTVASQKLLNESEVAEKFEMEVKYVVATLSTEPRNLATNFSPDNKLPVVLQTPQ